MGGEKLLPNLIQLAEYETGYSEEEYRNKIMSKFVHEFLRETEYKRCSEKDSFNIVDWTKGLQWIIKNQVQINAALNDMQKKRGDDSKVTLTFDDPTKKKGDHAQIDLG